MKLLKKYRGNFITWISFIFLYFATRLYEIMSLPIFTDEAIYTRWSQIARFDANWRFISLTDGKQPFLIWLDMTVMKFVSDPLLSGRLVSVFAGLFTMVGLYFLGKTLFNKKVGILASLLYLISPFALVYDRMALYDSLVATFAVWSLLFGILLVKFKRLDLALILGMILGGGVLNKTSGFISIYLLPTTLLLFKFSAKGGPASGWKEKGMDLLKWTGLALISIVLAYAYYSILRLSPFLHIIDEKNAIFIYRFSEWLDHPLRFFQGNLNGLWDWFIRYTTFPVVVLIGLSFFIGRNIREKLLLFSWFIFPFIALALFGRVLYPRFILFMTIPLLVLAAFSLNRLLAKARTRFLKVLIFILLLSQMFFSDYKILTDFANAPIPYLDLEQYINGWPAGGGTKEIINYLDNESKKGKIYVASLGTFGSLPTYTTEIYLGDNKNVEKRGIYPIPKTIPSDLVEKSKTMPTFVFVSNQSEFEEAIKNWPIKLLVEYKKGIETSYSRLYQVR